MCMQVTVYPKKYAHGFVVLCFVVVMQSFIMNSLFIHIHQGCFAGTGAIVRLPQCQWSKPDGYGKISQCITTTKHSKAKTVCIFLGIYCSALSIYPYHISFKISRKIPHSSPVRVSYGMLFVNAKSFWICIIITFVLCVLSCYRWPRFIESLKYMVSHFIACRYQRRLQEENLSKTVYDWNMEPTNDFDEETPEFTGPATVYQQLEQVSYFT